MVRGVMSLALIAMLTSVVLLTAHFGMLFPPIPVESAPTQAMATEETEATEATAATAATEETAAPDIASAEATTPASPMGPDYIAPPPYIPVS
ncbi:MAG: hypothetical protein JXE06_06625 [Coriobacteriia bacterium]|nr:hypothetical protein [Coriobacteriia bacterium]MBN2821918.1 hypothetical protein [Coriobacteriia bacterium]